MITPSTNVHHLFYIWNNKTVSVLFKIIYLVFKKYFDGVLNLNSYLIFIYYNYNINSIQNHNLLQNGVFYERTFICTKHCNYISYITVIYECFVFVANNLQKEERFHLIHSRTHQSIETINITRYENGIAAKIVQKYIFSVFYSYCQLQFKRYNFYMEH